MRIIRVEIIVCQSTFWKKLGRRAVITLPISNPQTTKATLLPTSIVANSLEGFRVSFVSTLAITPSCFLRISKCTLLDDTQAISKPEKKAESTSVVRIIIIEIGSTIRIIEKGSCYQLPFIYEKNFYLVALAFTTNSTSSLMNLSFKSSNTDLEPQFTPKSTRLILKG